MVWSEGRSWKRELASHLTLMSKGMAGLKNLGVLVKWIWYGEVTIAIPLRSASTMSLPEGRSGKGPGRLPSCPSGPASSLRLALLSDFPHLNRPYLSSG